MLTPDVNVLVAAYRADHPHHRTSRQWLEAALAEARAGGRLALLPMVCASFVRLVTHNRIFTVPSTAPEALDFVDALLASPGCELLTLGAEWPVFTSLCRGRDLSGNWVQDAWIAAAARTAGARLVTFDRDFERLLDPHERLLLESA